MILHDFRAKIEVKSLQKGEKMRSKFEAKKRRQKKRKKVVSVHSRTANATITVGFDGLAEAAGEVRRGTLRVR